MNNNQGDSNTNSMIQTFVAVSTEDTTTDTNVELSLEDKFFFKGDQADFKDETLQTELKAEASRLPSVLVDEELLKELGSIPDRFGFKIGDVADLLGIKQYVLRYWEEEFEILKPKKASNNQRLYTKKDVENAFLIRKLLYRDKFSIEGARQALKDVKFAVKKEKDIQKEMSSYIEHIHVAQTKILSFVEEIRKAKKLFN